MRQLRGDRIITNGEVRTIVKPKRTLIEGKDLKLESAEEMTLKTKLIWKKRIHASNTKIMGFIIGFQN